MTSHYSHEVRDVRMTRNGEQSKRVHVVNPYDTVNTLCGLEATEVWRWSRDRLERHGPRSRAAQVCGTCLTMHKRVVGAGERV
jgi:hypothetical protein|tara:strand:- start:403 stop:651 length:249 start_codon:yes stop_codon:yes gene_type:complete